MTRPAFRAAIALTSALVLAGCDWHAQTKSDAAAICACMAEGRGLTDCAVWMRGTLNYHFSGDRVLAAVSRVRSHGCERKP